MRSPKAKVCLKDNFKITTLLDTRVEINVMTRKLIEEANLAMRKGCKLELILHTCYSRPFLEICEDVEVAIGGMKIRHPIFFVEAGNHDFVLGQSFFNSLIFNKKYKPNGIFSSIIHPNTYKIAVFCTLASQDPTNQRENQIFL